MVMGAVIAVTWGITGGWLGRQHSRRERKSDADEKGENVTDPNL